jgi:hypothetical protein
MAHTPKFQIYALDPGILDAYLRDWIVVRKNRDRSLPASASFSDSLERAPLDEYTRRVALFGRGAWAMLEREGEPLLLAGMAACKYDDHHPGYFTLEYNGSGQIVGAGYWKRDEPGNWHRCEGSDLPPVFKQPPTD